MSSADSQSGDANRRVKVYMLGEDGHWDDRGTGYVHVEMIQDVEALGLRVLAEGSTDKVLLETKIFDEEVFQRQGDTIITWTNPDSRDDVALSFQEAPGAQEVWELVCQVQGRSPREGFGDDFDGEVGMHGHSHDDDVDIKMPMPEMDSLQQLLDIVCNATHVTRDRIMDCVMSDGYLEKLFAIYRDCEDLEMETSLHILFRLFKGLIMLNEPSLIEVCLSDAHIYDTMGILEHDPDYPNHCEAKHREYLQNPKLFKEAVPIKDAATLGRIHLNFRLTYLKDVVMARYIDDMSFGTIRELISLNNAEIVAYLHDNTKFLSQLFELCSNRNSCDDTWRNGYLFIRELFDISKPLGPQQQVAFYRSMARHGLFSIFHWGITCGDAAVRSACTDILLCTLNHDANLMREYLLKEADQSLLRRMIGSMQRTQDTGLKAQITEVMRLLLDSTTMELNPVRDEFLNIFYDKYMDSLLSPFLQEDKWDEEGKYLGESSNGGESGGAAGQPGGGEFEDSVADSDPAERRACWDTARGHIVDLLSFAVQHHSHRIKYYIMRHNVMPQVMRLVTQQRDKNLALSALRFLRQCVGVNDVYYNRHIAKHDLFSGVMQLLVRHKHRNNLINSAIVELFEHMRGTNMKELLKYTVEKYRSVFESITYVQTFNGIIIRYEQNQDALAEKDRDRGGGSAAAAGGAGGQGGAAAGRGGAASGGGAREGPREGPQNLAGRRGGGGMGSFRGRGSDDDDDSYFDEGDDDDDGSAAAATGAGGNVAPVAASAALDALSSYGDEDEGEEGVGGAGVGDKRELEEVGASEGQKGAGVEGGEAKRQRREGE